MFIVSIIAYVVVGAITGFLAGLLGISGGLITIPCLVWIFQLLDFPNAYIMQLAIGTSLASMTFNAISSAWAHHYKEAVSWELVRKMAPGLVIGCIIGAFIGDSLPTAILQLIFGLFAIATGIYFFRQKNLFDKSYPMPQRGTLNCIALGIGAISNLLGIGGGSMSVPFFLTIQLPMKKAIATSAGTGVIITFVGALAYLYFGLDEPFYSHSLGYIYLPAFAIIGIVSALTAPLGAKMTYRISTEKLKRIFAIFLMLIGIALMVH